MRNAAKERNGRPRPTPTPRPILRAWKLLVEEGDGEDVTVTVAAEAAEVDDRVLDAAARS